MKTALIAFGTLVLSSSAVFARDVNTTLPDDDTLSHITVQADAAPVNHTAVASMRGNSVIVKNDPVTMPD